MNEKECKCYADIKGKIEWMKFKAKGSIKGANPLIEAARKNDHREIEFYYKGVQAALKEVLEDLEAL